MHTRRDVLVLMASVFPAVVVGCKGEDKEDPATDPTTETEWFEPESIAESQERFPRTPMAGDATSTTMMIAFHVEDDSAVTLRVWEGEQLVVDESVEPSGDGFHKVRIDELTPGTTYNYAVFSGEAPAFTDRSLIGQVRTAPADDESPVVRFALLCCIGRGTILPDYYQPPAGPAPTTEPFQYELLTHASEHDLDAIVHLGDQAYLDFCWSLTAGEEADFLTAWGYYHGGGYRDVYPLAALYVTRDDHEASDNAAFDPWDMSPEDAALFDASEKAWFKVMPIDLPDQTPIWRSFRWGQTVELVMLDCRYELDGTHQMSEEQLLFLLDRIENSPCRFICVATPKPFSNIAEWKGIGDDNDERWENFVEDRGRVTDLINEIEARNVVFVCGDIHMNYFGRVTIDGTSVADTRTEVCVTSGNINPTWVELQEEQYEYVAAEPAFPVMTFDPDAGTVHVAFYLTDGSLGFEQTITDM